MINVSSSPREMWFEDPPGLRFDSFRATTPDAATAVVDLSLVRAVAGELRARNMATGRAGVR